MWSITLRTGAVRVHRDGSGYTEPVQKPRGPWRGYGIQQVTAARRLWRTLHAMEHDERRDRYRVVVSGRRRGGLRGRGAGGAFDCTETGSASGLGCRRHRTIAWNVRTPRGSCCPGGRSGKSFRRQGGPTTATTSTATAATTVPRRTRRTTDSAGGARLLSTRERSGRAASGAVGPRRTEGRESAGPATGWVRTRPTVVIVTARRHVHEGQLIFTLKRWGRRKVRCSSPPRGSRSNYWRARNSRTVRPPARPRDHLSQRLFRCSFTPRSLDGRARRSRRLERVTSIPVHAAALCAFGSRWWWRSGCSSRRFCGFLFIITIIIPFWGWFLMLKNFVILFKFFSTLPTSLNHISRSVYTSCIN